MIFHLFTSRDFSCMKKLNFSPTTNTTNPPLCVCNPVSPAEERGNQTNYNWPVHSRNGTVQCHHPHLQISSQCFITLDTTHPEWQLPSGHHLMSMKKSLLRQLSEWAGWISFPLCCTASSHHMNSSALLRCNIMHLLLRSHKHMVFLYTGAQPCANNRTSYFGRSCIAHSLNCVQKKRETIFTLMQVFLLKNNKGKFICGRVGLSQVEARKPGAVWICKCWILAIISKTIKRDSACPVISRLCVYTV